MKLCAILVTSVLSLATATEGTAGVSVLHDLLAQAKENELSPPVKVGKTQEYTLPEIPATVKSTDPTVIEATIKYRHKIEATGNKKGSVEIHVEFVDGTKMKYKATCR
jgi:hypothetical protein